MQNSRHIILNHASLNIQSLVIQAIVEDIDAFVDGNYRIGASGEISKWEADGIAPATDTARAIGGFTVYRLPNEATAEMRDLLGQLSNLVVEVNDARDRVEPAGSLDNFEEFEFSVVSSRFKPGAFASEALEVSKLQITVKPRFKPKFVRDVISSIEAGLAATFIDGASGEEVRLIPGTYHLTRADAGLLSYYPDYNPDASLRVAICLFDTEIARDPDMPWPVVDERTRSAMMSFSNALNSVPELAQAEGWLITLSFADAELRRGPSIQVKTIWAKSEQ